MSAFEKGSYFGESLPRFTDERSQSMSGLKRYTIRGWECIYEPDSEGKWVLFEDADKRIRELDAEGAELKHDITRYMEIATSELNRAGTTEAAIKAAVEAEREACAVLASDSCHRKFDSLEVITACDQIAEVIRARGEEPEHE